MNTRADDDVERYAYLWRAAPYEVRWVIWNSAGDTMVFDRDINCPVFIDDGATLRGSALTIRQNPCAARPCSSSRSS